MKISTRRRTILEVAAVILAIGILAGYAQLTKTQYATASITATKTTTVTNVNLGALTGGTPSTQTFNNVVVFTVTTGTHTVTASISVNATLWQSVDVYVLNTGGQACELKGGSAVSAIPSCTWTITGSSTYNEQWLTTPSDGFNVPSTSIPVTFSLN